MDRVIEYLEKPTLHDEKHIAAILERLLSSVKKKDIDELSSLFSDNARIAMYDKNEKLYEKSEHLEEMKKLMREIHTINYKSTLIRLKNEKEATVSCCSIIKFRGKLTPIPRERFFTFRQYDGIWYITKVLYGD
ncbi:MAG: hypothetical protein A3C11_00505 [Candidatus Sungbacteria bacterium RIFCSPHIGHO2_02_FULL_49_12]|uniref:DUF4440 domain-containing protein n=1 Tax=Candidatus Sungbacteria bacterium RIFCSPHIGHO2_02_FULL_49_12 TaxID=1802271 RepID=A0A1G2KMM8_9BACT|nr:MAG: hypothetical protein A3C11_00505 [Candidatus Sungbacteria bacterium RIFCSPHIGHO2_02_FULL_49_12]